MNAEEKCAHFYEFNRGFLSESRAGSDILLEFKNFLGGKENLSFLSQVCGFKINSLKDSFVSKYAAGYFKGISSDPYGLPKYKLHIMKKAHYFNSGFFILNNFLQI